MSLDSRTAAAIGRPDMQRRGVDYAAWSMPAPTTGAVVQALGAKNSVSGWTPSAPSGQVPANTGAISLGLIAAGAIGLGAFYFWTREYQNDGHFHTGVHDIALYTVSAVIGINVLRLVAVKMAAMGGPFHTLGSALGATVTFGG